MDPGFWGRGYPKDDLTIRMDKSFVWGAMRFTALLTRSPDGAAYCCMLPAVPSQGHMFVARGIATHFLGLYWLPYIGVFPLRLQSLPTQRA